GEPASPQAGGGKLLLRDCTASGITRRLPKGRGPGSGSRDARRIARGLLIAMLLGGLAGCQTVSQSINAWFEAPPQVPAGAVAELEQNPVYVPPVSYGQVFETVL